MKGDMSLNTVVVLLVVIVGILTLMVTINSGFDSLTASVIPDAFGN